MNLIKDIIKKDIQISLENKRFIDVSYKADKLVYALYMITNLFPDSEPIKDKIRNKSLEFLSFIFLISDKNNFAIKNKIVLKVAEIDSLLNLSFKTQLLSEMNYSVMKTAFENFLDLLSDVCDENKLFAQNFLNDFKGHSKGQDNYKRQDTEVTLKSQPEKNKNVFVEKNILKVLKDKPKASEGSERRYAILNFIKDKKEVGIKDIASVIKDTSEKTIQRELTAMVAEGVLKKEGERRWSRYSLS